MAMTYILDSLQYKSKSKKVLGYMDDNNEETLLLGLFLTVVFEILERQKMLLLDWYNLTRKRIMMQMY